MGGWVAHAPGAAFVGGEGGWVAKRVWQELSRALRAQRGAGLRGAAAVPRTAMALAARGGWVQKKPTSQSTKAWRSATKDTRYIEANGFTVTYYTHAPADRPAKAKPRGAFDLRDVTMLRESPDSTAPRTAIEMQVKKHQ